MKVREQLISSMALIMNISLEVFYLSKILSNYSVTVNLKILGRSMIPTFYENDIVKVQACAQYKLGDIIIYPACHGQSIIIHRIIGISKKKIITKGDGNKTYDVPISSRAILGKVVLEKDDALSRIVAVVKSVKMMKIHDIVKFLSMLYKR